MFDIDKILGNKKQKKRVSFTNMTLSNTIGKNPISSLLQMATTTPKKGAAPLYKQKQWADFPHQKRQSLRKKYKDTDGDRIPNGWDCDPQNVMKQDWGTGSGAPAFTYPRSYGYRKRLTHMSPTKYMQLAKKGYNDEASRNMPDEEHERRVISKSNVERLKPIIQSKYGKMTVPILETKRGKIVDHEGRHRAIAAKELGMQEIPVFMVESDKDYIDYMETQKPIKAMKWESKDPKMADIENEWEQSIEHFKKREAQLNEDK